MAPMAFAPEASILDDHHIDHFEMAQPPIYNLGHNMMEMPVNHVDDDLLPMRGLENNNLISNLPFAHLGDNVGFMSRPCGESFFRRGS